MAPRNARASRETEREGRRSRGNRDTVGRERVMQVALQSFLANGFSGTSLKSIANELKISTPALYWYFPSKEELYVSVIKQAMDDFISYVQESITDNDPLFKLSQLVRAHVTWQLQQSELARAFDLTMSLKGRSVGIPESRLEPIVKLELEYREQVRSILREGVEAGLFDIDDVKTTAFAIITMCEYVTTWYKPEGELSVAAVANRYEGLARRMVGAASRRLAQSEGSPEGR